MSSANLPFGKTDITAEEYREQIDYDRALELLEENGVEDAQKKLDSFINKVPELLKWLEENGREYPWRYTTDPWKVFVAEVLLRKTRADLVEPVYENFVRLYPSPEALIKAEEKEVRALIRTLGLVNLRTNMLLKSAKKFVDESNGQIPDTVEAFEDIKGIGRYITGTTLLFGHKKPRPVIDPNIVRTLEYIMKMDFPERYHKKKEIIELMDVLTPSNPEIARSFYFGLIDRGADLAQRDFDL